VRVPFVTALSAILLAAACDSGSRPTTPPPAPSGRAFLQGSTLWSWGDCLGDLGCYFLTSIQNVGTGCASGTSVVVRFYDGNNAQRGLDMRMEAGPPGALKALTIRPDEIVAISSAFPLDPFVSYRIFPTWTEVDCP
jgi:hypothetical protein